MELRALIIDESAIMRHQVMAAIRECNLGSFTFVEAANAAEADQALSESAIHLCLAHWNFAEPDTRRFVERLRAETGNGVPVIGLSTNHALRQNRQAQSQVELDGWIVKTVFRRADMPRAHTRAEPNGPTRAPVPRGGIGEPRPLAAAKKALAMANRQASRQSRGTCSGLPYSGQPGMHAASRHRAHPAQGIQRPVPGPRPCRGGRPAGPRSPPQRHRPA